MNYITETKPQKELIDSNLYSLRKQEELSKVIGIPNKDKLFKHPTSKVGFGEYGPTIENRLKRMKYYLDSVHHKNPKEKFMFEKFCRIRDEYEYYGLRLGLLFGGIAYFFPGIRRLPFYGRIPISILAYLFVFRSIRNYGDDVFEQRSFIIFENYERRLGLRNFVTAI